MAATTVLEPTQTETIHVLESQPKAGALISSPSPEIANLETSEKSASPTAQKINATKLLPKPEGSKADVNRPSRLNELGEKPAFIDCPYCYKRVITRVEKHNTNSTNMAAVVCCLCFGVLGVWIPYAFHWGADVDHYCTTCNNRVAHLPHKGTTQIFGSTEAPPAHAEREKFAVPLVQGDADRPMEVKEN